MKNHELDTIFKTRFHGAINIRGIRYQILFSVLRAFELYKSDDKIHFIRLEGIEDLDILGKNVNLIGLRCGNEYIQVKSSDKPWNWVKLKEPIKRFLEVYRTDPYCNFTLAVNFPLRTDIERLANFESLPLNDKKRVKKKTLNLIQQIGATHNEAKELFTKLHIVSLPEEQILYQLRLNVTNVYELRSDIVNFYILVLVAKFLEWAEERKTINWVDLDNIRIDIGENLARETKFQAYGDGLINRISWEADKNINDFFDGKGTRPGHIVADVDVKRLKWLEKIDSTINSAIVCILRSSSGQGKSTLLYRYAYEYWPWENTYILRLTETNEQVELVRNYLQFRVSLGLPLLLLIDGADWRTRLWPFIAQKCIELGIRVLVTVRNEDWYRFGKESLMGYEIIEPSLDLDEAREIFNIFKDKERLHTSVDSPEWAYEKIGKPHLLMEYVYLLTHGKMLEERLRDQVKQFSDQKEDPAKIDILRKAALADVLGVPVIASKLLQDVQLRDDPQKVLQSLTGEYIYLKNGIITGLHWIRSDHLSRLLHEGYPELANTAMSILAAIPTEDIPVFVSNALCLQNLNFDLFFKGLAEKAKNAKLATILAFLNGIFEAGERQFFIANQNLFDEAFKLIGPSGPLLLSTDFMPTIKLDTLAQMVKILGDKGENFRILKEIASRFLNEPRGLDLCYNFLVNIHQSIQSKTLYEDLSDTGLLLDWCSLSDISLPAWLEVHDDLFEQVNLFDLPLEVFCNFAQGVYRYDESTYLKWFSKNRVNILGFLKLHTDCIEVEIKNKILTIKFFPNTEDSVGTNEQSINRLKKLRSAIPFCDYYQSEGICLLPFRLKPNVDESQKKIPVRNLPYESDVDKNVVWRKIIESYYLPDSVFQYEKFWQKVRQDALLFVQGLSKGLERIIVGKSFNFQNVFENGELLVRLAESLKRLPDPPSQLPQDMSDNLKKVPKSWASSLLNFIFQSHEYAKDKCNKEMGRLAVYNFLDAVKYLPQMHEAFKKVFENGIPDYFNVTKLNSIEINAYSILADLVDAWILNPPDPIQKDILHYLRIRKKQKQIEIINQLKKVLAPIEKDGIVLLFPSDLYIQHPLKYFPLAFSVEDPCHPEKELEAIIKILSKAGHPIDFFCLRPIYKGNYFLEDGYQISSSQLIKIEMDPLKSWEALVPVKISDAILSLLPSRPFKTIRRLELKRKILELYGQIQILVEKKNKIERLKESKNKYEILLYTRYDNQLRELEENIGTIASTIDDFIKTYFSSQLDNSHIKKTRKFLKIIIETSQHSEISDYFKSDNINIESVQDFLNITFEF